MAKKNKREFASSNASGVCEKLFNAFNISPRIRPLRSLTLRADMDPKDRVAACAKAVATSPAVLSRPQGGRVDIEYVPELAPKQPEQTKDINDKVKDYINQTKFKFHGNSHYVP